MLNKSLLICPKHRVGRVGRIGQSGSAISLFTERDEDLAPELVALLKELGQDVPDFLREFDIEQQEPVDAAGVVGDDSSPAVDGAGWGEDATDAVVDDAW